MKESGSDLNMDALRGKGQHLVDKNILNEGDKRNSGSM